MLINPINIWVRIRPSTVPKENSFIKTGSDKVIQFRLKINEKIIYK